MTLNIFYTWAVRLAKAIPHILDHQPFTKNIEKYFPKHLTSLAQNATFALQLRERHTASHSCKRQQATRQGTPATSSMPPDSSGQHGRRCAHRPAAARRGTSRLTENTKTSVLNRASGHRPRRHKKKGKHNYGTQLQTLSVKPQGQHQG